MDSFAGPFSALSVDMGSSSIKVLRADVGPDGSVRLTEPRSIEHQPVQRGPYLEWDVEQLVLDVVAQESGRAPAGRLAVSIDGWGNGLVFLDRHGRRVGPVRCYRDPGLARADELVRRRGWPELVGERTGCRVGIDSTLVQLVAVLDERPAWLSDVVRVVPLVDHLGDLLSGAGADAAVGLSPASSSGFVDPRTGRIDRELLEQLEIPSGWVPDPQPELRTAGRILDARLADGVQGLVVKVAGHDTATALVAGPARTAGRCFVGLGSWAVAGAVVGPELRGAAPFRLRAPVVHEATAEGDLRVNHDIPGMRLVQQLEREQLGRPATAAERTALFPEPGGWEQAPVVDVLGLDVHASLVEQVQVWGRAAGRPVGTFEQQLREVLRGIAAAVADTVGQLAAAGLTSPGPGIWMCGGGVRVQALPVWIAELTGWSVELGPVEASALGGALGAVGVVRADDVESVGSPGGEDG
ncbi:MAG TPA: FGGY family carbohydrate kinase [Friedmanniella sp.]